MLVTTSAAKENVPPEAIVQEIFATVLHPFTGELCRVIVENVRTVYGINFELYCVADVCVLEEAALPFGVRREELQDITVFYTLEV